MSSSRAATVFLWALAAVLVIRSSTMQYMLTSGGSSATSTQMVSGRSMSMRGARRSQDKIGMNCEGAGGSAKGPEGLWGTYTLRQVVPTVAIVVTLALAFCSFSPVESQQNARVMHSIPLTGAPAGIRKSIERLIPTEVQRSKEQQQALITGLGLIVPFAVGALQDQGAIPKYPEEQV